MDFGLRTMEGQVHTLLVVPLIESYSEGGGVRKNVIGAIVLLNKKNENGKVIRTDFEGNEGGFSTLDRRILESISPHIETIISNTKKHQELKRISVTDGLTGLYNHSYFFNCLLDIEFSRSRRYGTPLSMLLADIDYFKVFNDVFGHQVGDLILREVACILLKNTRSVDHIARYGGEEFAILLHNTGANDAVTYAEKIRKQVEAGNYAEKICAMHLFNVHEALKRFRAILEIDDKKIREAKFAIMKRHFGLNLLDVIKLEEEGRIAEAGELILNSFKVTISIGIAHCPHPEITEKNDLVTNADMLLLKAKEHGRNRVESASA